ncbi:hypothetical protein NKR19_g1485 [Coniochaeta hoffmannii]|uniref:G-patch domain-containing protein n=1 Tax=Coniochaeta hoffmannii TaxID=91930 RepID=A0AA38VZX8_9PEZI|nr:hypothetical protein NKR19_g1485 [Coniochaeta hoffmannii]
MERKREDDKEWRRNDEDDEVDEVPLHRKRAFGSGLKRKPIAFVPAQDGDLSSTFQPPNPDSSVEDLYLSLVLPKEAAASKEKAKETLVCEVCKLPLASNPEEGHDEAPELAVLSRKHHEASLAHQVCLTHSHPPSALDRSRVGLNILESHGWDPDARAGLGAAEQGIQFPLKPTPKDDKVGIGVEVPKNLPKKKEKPRNLDAGKVRKMAQRDQKRAEQLRRQFYGNSDLEKYLGPGA